MESHPHLTNADPGVAVLEGAVKRYGSVLALDGIDLTVRKGELVSLLGHNGAGKTTAIRLLLGLSAPTAGRVRVFGADPHDRATRTRIGACLQVNGLPGTLTVREHLTLFASYYSVHRDSIALHFTGACASHDHTFTGTLVRVLITRNGAQVNTA